MEFISNEQKKIVLDQSRIKKICGCAGSRKTDTMIKCGIHFLEKSKRSKTCMFLTLVGSVTDEITTRLERELGIKIEKQGMSNHYIGNWKNHMIEVANFDAFIHRQLQDHQDVSLFSDDFDEKARQLLKLIKDQKQSNFKLKNGQNVSMLLVDEFQDISISRVQILIHFFKQNLKTRLIVLGDILQTIFPQALEEHQHPLMIINELNPSEFRLNICFRCPKSHLDVVNCMTKTFRKQYSIPEMIHHFDIPHLKPLFFTHESISNHQGALETAKTVFSMIQVLKREDPDIEYRDIVIIMKRSNHQLVFQNLLHLFTKNNLQDSCLLSKTKTLMNEHIPIDWNEGKEKLMMLSIHGDKGKGHPVVFFLGFSGGTIPEERHFYKMEELLSQSILNVALTRSSKYLFIGMTRTYPSIYFFQSYGALKDLAYFSWKHEDIQHPVLSMICQEALKRNSDTPLIHRCSIRKQSLLTPTRNMIYIQNDDHCKNLIKKKPTVKKIRIGSRIHFSKDEEKLYILNGLVKLVFLINIKFSIFKSIFEPYIIYFKQNWVSYTDNYDLLCIVKDYQLNRYIHKSDYWMGIASKYNWKHFKHPVLIMHKVFEDSIMKSIENVCKKDYSSRDLWNIAIFFIEYIEHNNAGIHILYQYKQMHEDIGSIEKNIQEFIKYFQNIDANAFLRLRFHQKASIMDSIINRSELEELGFQSDLDQDRKFFLEGYRFGVSSTIDFYDKNTQTLIDFRIGLKSECKEEWIIQNIINSLISQENKFSVIKQVVIYNVLKGQMYTFQNLHKYSLNTVIEPLLIKYDFHEKLIQRLLKNKSKKE